MALPPSWKSEVQKAVEETTAAERNKWKAEQDKASTTIAAAIDALRDAQAAQTNSEDGNEKKNQAINKATLVLVAFTVLFTGLSWWAFRSQLDEMKKVYGPVSEQADAAKKAADATVRAADAATKQSENSDKALAQAQRAWIGPTYARIDGSIEIGKPFSVIIEYLNTGREPGISFAAAGDVFLGTQEEDDRGINLARVEAYFKGCRDANMAKGGQVIFPSVGGGIGGGNRYDFTLGVKDSTVDQDFLDGKTILYVDGCLVYRSINVVRHSYFCYFYKSKLSKPASLSICQNGNGAD